MASDDRSRPFRVLVVEDEYLIALEVETLLDLLGCQVIGPAPSVARAHALIERERPDFALLDVNLGSERSTPIAERLQSIGVPYALATGYGASQLPEPPLRDAPRLSKPVGLDALRRLISELAGLQAGPERS